MERLFIVSNSLPGWISNDRKFLPSGIFSALKDIKEDFHICWVGCSSDDSHRAGSKEEILWKTGQNQSFIPIDVPHQEYHEYFSGFSNSSLWPLLHYMAERSIYNDSWFDAYCSINQRFADKLIQHCSPGDIIWIHDYPLMLLPSLLKSARQELKVGFFLHTPFPSYEVFRYHPRREELLKGMLGADLIGFHTFGYLRHFRSSVLRLLRLESDINIITQQGFTTHIGVYPIGINWIGIQKVMKSDEYVSYLKEYRKRYSEKKIVLSIEPLNRTKGIPIQLQAINKFLEDYPDEREQTIFIIIVTPSFGTLTEIEPLSEEVELIVGRINGKYSSLTNIPIHFINKTIEMSQLCALYTLADVALVTPLIDGMNLIAKEFVACQRDNQGVLVLSEFAGAAQELFNSIIVNPHNVNEVAESIHFALHLSSEKKSELLHSMRERVIKHDASEWAFSFLKKLKSISTDIMGTFINKSLEESTLEGFRNRSGKKALFLDYDGTLREFEKDPSKASPSQELMELFKRFQERDDLDVFIVSGRDQNFLQEHLGESKLTLVAEHGFYVREPGENWKLLNEKVDLSWKEKIREIFELYALSTPGSFVESKTSTIVWHYRKSDPEFGIWKANELIGELTEVISNLPIEIHHGHLIVEVRSFNVSKDKAMEHYMAKNKYDLVLAAGDDQTDENMFRYRSANVITVKIGAGETKAEYQIPFPNQFRKLLGTI